MDNMLHRKSSKLSSLRNDNASSEVQLAATALRNRKYTTANPMDRQKSKRLKVAAVSESPPKCGPVSSRLRPRTNVGSQRVAMPLLLKKVNGEYSEGSRRKNKAKDTEGTKDSPRYKVKKLLRLFSVTCRKFLREKEARPSGVKKVGKFRVDYKAAEYLRSKGDYTKINVPVVGHVPGVEVGDEYQFRMELNIIGIHRQPQGGIDYKTDKNTKKLIATSIVSSGCYDDDVDNSDIVIYTGQGGNVMKGTERGQQYREPKDQELVTGNLALFNSVEVKNPVRVIRGQKNTSSSDEVKNYVYDGLYLVEKCWDEIGPHGKRVYKFKLRRIPKQPELSWILLKKTKTSKLRDARYNADIAQGKERFPIFAVNELDDEKLPPFIYTAEMIYPDWCKRVPPKGCECKGRCSKSEKCSCVKKNDNEESPYNPDGALVETKPVVYECGPHCTCPPSCYLKVSQQGIKFPLEIFKTESRGWGVRSVASIPSGSFICEYVGELLEEKEAEKLTGDGEDVYLFDIDKVDEESGFAIDAGKKGNIGRFINHSCSPNLYAQEVLYDHANKRMPHIMFFAGDNIPPLQELTYDYNYQVDTVCDSDGNIKTKDCYCGSSDCTGRLY